MNWRLIRDEALDLLAGIAALIIALVCIVGFDLK